MITAENITPRKYNVKGTVTTVFYGKVNTKLIGINNVLRGNLALARQKKQRKIITDQNITRQRREKSLETQPNVEKKRNVTERIPKAGGLNILGWFRNFIGKIVLGVLAVQLVGQAPLLKNILTGALKVADFLSSAGVFLVDAFSTFINFGYNAYDSTRGFLKNIGGDSVINLFDGFMDKLSVLVDVLLVASLLKGTGSFDPLMRRGRQPKPQRTPNLLEQLFGGKKKSKRGAPTGLGRGITPTLPFIKSPPGAKEARRAIDRKARALAKERRIAESKERARRGAKRRKGLSEPLETREKQFGGRRSRFVARKKLADANRIVRRNTIQLTQFAVGDFDPNKPASEKVFSRSDINKLNRLDKNLYQAQLRGDALDIETQTRVRNDFYNRMLKKAGGRRRKIIRKKLIQAELLRRKGQSAPTFDTDGVKMTAPRPSVSEVLKGRKGKDRQFFKKLERDPKMRRRAAADFESQQADEALRRLMGQRRPDDFDPGMSDLARAIDSSGRARVRGRGAQRAPKRFLIRTFGKQGTRILRSVPLIGGILDFGLNLAFGEPIGRAAGKAVFAGIGGFIGGAIGKALGLLTGPFAVVVSPLLAGLFGLGGGALGDWIGGLVYDAVTKGMDLPAFLTQNPLTGFFEKASEKVSDFINNLVEGVTEFFGLGEPSIVDRLRPVLGGYPDEEGKAPPPTSRPGSKGIPLPPRKPAIPPRKSPMGGKVNFGSLLDLVTSGEGGLNSVNRGNAGDTPGGAKSILGKNLTDMTLDEVFAAQNAERVFAVGKYQIIPKTMKGFRDYLIAQGIDTSRRKFDASLQNMFGPYSINQKRAKVGRFLRGDTSVSLDTAQLELAAEYASIGVPYDMKKGSYNGKYPLRDIKKGESLYSGTGSNYAPAAHTDSIRSMLQKLREKASYEDQSSSNIIINSDQIASNNQPQVNTESPDINISVASGGGDPFDGLYVM
tara:strand:- start:1514 stop:4369 length:2856 start_codon:yes stop_codon:yes gene_type:complete